MLNKELKFVELHEDIVINGITIPARTRLPVALTPEENAKDASNGMDVTPAKIIEGMMEAVRLGAKGENVAYYKKILLADENLLDRLRTASIAKGASSEESDLKLNLEILSSILALDDSEISYVNYARGLINAIHFAEDEESADECDEQLFACLKSGLRKYPDSYSLNFHLSDFHKNQGNFELAKKYSENAASALKKNKCSGKEEFEALKKLDAEISGYEKMHESILYIYDLISLEKTKEAKEKAKEFLEENPDDWHASMLLGWAMRIDGEYAEAKNHLLDSISNGGGDFAETYNELSLCEWETGDRELALKYMEMAFDIDGSSITYACNAATMCLDLKKYDDAFKFLFDAARIDKDDAILGSLIKRYENDSGSDFLFPDDFDKNLSELNKKRSAAESEKSEGREK